MAIARLDEVLVSALGGALEPHTLAGLPAAAFSADGVAGLDPIDNGRPGRNSLALRNRGLLRGEEDGLAAARLMTAACGKGGDEAGEVDGGTVI